MSKADKVGSHQFHIMCSMFGVDSALEALHNMGMTATNEQVEAERMKEAETIKKWNSIFLPKEW